MRSLLFFILALSGSVFAVQVETIVNETMALPKSEITSEEITNSWNQLTCYFSDPTSYPILVKFMGWANREHLLDLEQREETQVFLENCLDQWDKTNEFYYLNGLSSEKTNTGEKITVMDSENPVFIENILATNADILSLTVPNSNVSELYENFKTSYAHFYIVQGKSNFSQFIASKYSLDFFRRAIHHDRELLAFAITDGYNLLGQMYIPNVSECSPLFFSQQGITCEFLEAPTLTSIQFLQGEGYQDTLLCQADSSPNDEECGPKKPPEVRRELDGKFSGGIDSKGNSYVNGNGSYKRETSDGKSTSYGVGVGVKKNNDGSVEGEVEFRGVRRF